MGFGNFRYEWNPTIRSRVELADNWLKLNHVGKVFPNWEDAFDLIYSAKQNKIIN